MTAGAVAPGPDDEQWFRDHNFDEDEIREHLSAAGDETPPDRPALLDWAELYATDFGDVEWLAGKLMAKGQQIALVGAGKAGKSLFSQEWAWRMSAGLPFLGDTSRDPARVLYVDAENGWTDLQDRFRSFGATPDTLGNLAYASFPSLPPLDTLAGGAALFALAQDTGAEVVWIDTVSRFITGKENDADTWLALYRHTLRLLKGAGIASVRLDHFGKDQDRGARGNSAKTQDVDHVWELTEAGGGGLHLRRTHTRTGIGDGIFAIHRLSEKHQGRWKPGGTRHVVALPWDGEYHELGDVADAIKRLDAAGIPDDWGRDRIGKECNELGIRIGKTKLSQVVKHRKDRAKNLPPHLPYPSVTESDSPAPANGAGPDVPADQTCPGQVEGRSGAGTPDLPAPSPPLRRGQVGQPDPNEDDRPLPASGIPGVYGPGEWAAHGHPGL